MAGASQRYGPPSSEDDLCPLDVAAMRAHLTATRGPSAMRGLELDECIEYLGIDYDQPSLKKVAAKRAFLSDVAASRPHIMRAVLACLAWDGESDHHPTAALLDEVLSERDEEQSSLEFPHGYFLDCLLFTVYLSLLMFTV